MIYRLGAAGAPGLPALLAAMDKARFTPCAPSQAVSMGWTEPRGEAHAPLVEVVSGHWLMQLRFEQKILPSSVIKRRVEERALEIEKTTGRKPGKRQSKELKEEAMLDLLPMAFTKQSSMSSACRA